MHPGPFRRFRRYFGSVRSAIDREKAHTPTEFPEPYTGRYIVMWSCAQYAKIERLKGEGLAFSLPHEEACRFL
jgi:hypothetical protein